MAQSNVLTSSPIQSPAQRPRLRRPGFISEIIQTIIFIVAATVLFDMAIPRSLVDGSSMEPTFQDGNRLIVSRLHYLAGGTQRGDIIVFNSLEAPPEQGVMLIKRVIGLPGETVTMRDGQVSIDGNLLVEEYIREACLEYRCPDQEWVLADDEYFVMGDNRNHSRDSRRFGPVAYDKIVGMVVFRYFPLNELGIIDGHSEPQLIIPDNP